MAAQGKYTKLWGVLLRPRKSLLAAVGDCPPQALGPGRAPWGDEDLASVAERYPGHYNWPGAATVWAYGWRWWALSA